MISRNSASDASASRLRRSLRPARRQGLLPETSWTLSPGASLTSGSGSKANSAIRLEPSLLHRRLVNQEVPLRAELVALDARREHVDVLRVDHWNPGGSVDDRLVGLRPCLVRRVDVRDALLQG